MVGFPVMAVTFSRSMISRHLRASNSLLTMKVPPAYM